MNHASVGWENKAKQTQFSDDRRRRTEDRRRRTEYRLWRFTRRRRELFLGYFLLVFLLFSEKTHTSQSNYYLLRQTAIEHNTHHDSLKDGH